MSYSSSQPPWKTITGGVAFLVAVTLILSAGWVAVDDTEHCFKIRYGRIVDEHVSSGISPEWWIYDHECLPMVDQQIPHGESGDDDASSWMEVTIETNDRVPLVLPIRAVVRYREESVREVFLDKRTQAAIIGEVRSGIVAGVTQGGNLLSLDEIFDGGLERLALQLKNQTQEEVGRLAEVVNMYVGQPRMPTEIRNARNAARQRAEEIQQELQQLQKDSISAANQRIVAVEQAQATRTRAQAYADSVRLTMEAEATAFSRNSSLAQLRATEAASAALAKLLENCTTNCVIGASMLENVLGQIRSGGR